MSDIELEVDLERPEDLSSKSDAAENKATSTSRMAETQENTENNQNIEIPNKPIRALTDEERRIIIENAKNNIDNKYYTVKLFKNGEARICKKKTPNLSSKLISSKNDSKSDLKNDLNKVYLSDNQLLMEHILELNNKINELQCKHKKLKKRYNKIKNDIYEDVEADNVESENIEATSTRSLRETQEAAETQERPEDFLHSSEAANPCSLSSKSENNIYKPTRSGRGWRSMVKYL